jgi:hypothetical protein
MTAPTTSIVINFTPTKVDILRAAFLALRARPLTLAFSVGFFVVLPWFSALIAIAASAAGADVSTWWIFELIVIPPLAVALFSAIPLMQVRGARSLNGTHTYEFSDRGIHLTGPGFDNRVDWSILTRCYSFKPGLLFVSGNAPLITVPSHSLSAVNKAELGRLLAAKGVQARSTW